MSSFVLLSSADDISRPGHREIICSVNSPEMKMRNAVTSWIAKKPIEPSDHSNKCC